MYIAHLFPPVSNHLDCDRWACRTCYLSNAIHYFNRSATSSATSFTWISPPSALAASVIIAMQKGQPTASVAASAEGAAWSVAFASAKRAAFTRVDPGSSSFHICAPPAPQQNDLAELRGISMV